jgi:hypothetical protein
MNSLIIGGSKTVKTFKWFKPDKIRLKGLERFERLELKQDWPLLAASLES